MKIKEIFEAVKAGQYYMVKTRETGNNTYEQIADKKFAKLAELTEPTSKDGTGGIIWQELNGSKMYLQISDKQAWCIAYAFAKVNDIK
ncbi:MAG: hypothetical protein FWF54_03550 [Candidatus Azobacteroides sp.]|nr:hypothetical protein [Candidatus Azobacteroides sp.]